ncbi:MAG: hypothetical protein ABSG98_02935 [Anaerolineales bacterium]|jgi:hypothetical protein
MFAKEKKKPTWLSWFLALVLAACLLRLGFWFAYSPRRTSDLQGYLDVAQMILRMDFSHNEGARAPGYPALLAISGLDERTVWAVQMGLGILISTLLFTFSWNRLRNGPWAFLIALAYSLNLGQLFFEATMLAETLSTLLLLVSLGLAAWIRPGRKRNWLPALLLGAVLGIAVLTRPEYIYLFPVVLVYVYWQARGEPARRRTLLVCAYLLPWMALVLGWSTVNWFTTNYFGPTTMTGYYLMNHTGNFIQYAPQEYATVRDIYLKHRAEQIAATGNQSMTIWRSFNNLQHTMRLSYAGLSELLTRLSLILIVQHPFLYLQSVSVAWVDFWKVANYWDPKLVRVRALVPWLGWIWEIERYLIVGLNVLFLELGTYWVFRWIRKQLTPEETPLLWIWILVLLGSVFQALLERGDNARYAVSSEVIILWTVLVTLGRFLTTHGKLPAEDETPVSSS